MFDLNFLVGASLLAVAKAVYYCLLVKDFLDALTASALDFFYLNSLKFAYIDDVILIFLLVTMFVICR